MCENNLEKVEITRRASEKIQRIWKPQFEHFLAIKSWEAVRQ